VEGGVVRQLPRDRSISIGLLSNLTADKGAIALVSIFGGLVAEMGNLTLRLAGPVTDKEVEKCIAQAETEFQGKFEYLGSVSGNSKIEFYRSIDLFVFPSTYKNEAQPLVLIEAMSFGIPIVAYDIGFVRELVGNAGLCGKPSLDFLEHAVALFIKNSELRADYCTASRARYEELFEEGDEQFYHLLNILTSDTYPVLEERKP